MAGERRVVCGSEHDAITIAPVGEHYDLSFRWPGMQNQKFRTKFLAGACPGDLRSYVSCVLSGWYQYPYSYASSLPPPGPPGPKCCKHMDKRTVPHMSTQVHCITSGGVAPIM